MISDMVEEVIQQIVEENKEEKVREPIADRFITLNVNGKDYVLHGIAASETLADVLRDRLGLTGTKVACDEGACGSCTVMVDGEPTLSCMTLAVTMVGKRILTIEGLLNGPNLHPIQQSFIEERGAACGYCTSGFIMTTKAFLDENPQPTVDEIKQALAGNICRCAVYEHIVKSVESAAKKVQESA